MFKLRKGTTRFTIVVFNWFVIKLPNLKGFFFIHAWGDFKYTWKTAGIYEVWRGGYLGKVVKGLTTQFFMALSANVAEGFLWTQLRSNFLQPTFSFVFFNLQKYAGERVPTYEELLPFFRALPEKATNYLHTLDPHQYYMTNWRIVDDRLVLIDYGGKLYDSSSFIYLISRWHKEIDEVLSKPLVA